MYGCKCVHVCCVRKHVCAHLCMCVHRLVYVCAYVHVYAHLCLCVCTCVHAYVFLHLCACVCDVCVGAFVCARMYVCVGAFVCAHVCVCTRVWLFGVCVRVHAHIWFILFAYMMLLDHSYFLYL